MNEENIIKELKSGNLAALDDLFKLYSSQALKTAYLITNDRYIAEDVVQETFIQCYRSIRALKNNKAFKPWFYKILTRLSYREIKRAKRQLPIENVFEKADSSFYDKYFDGEGEIFDCINGLSLKHRTAVILYYFNDMSIREIAESMGCCEGTVKSRLSAARKKLKEALSNEI